ncbi:uncharacterized protein BDW43DRAFT_308377 [Aspergillus alliaceus]|uniref:uncharacterized protein n=1 Tax=Petromyces alliaceus TaxID=209559 RepID=UPI0012A5E09A|nr:uncharacterized protein BDW43DRAFT_308377 [Aspergillus alliaceus]KAB8236701.1 hypothetical protein BDW43DRAFT_308377 [Aspergillus alliaceus]
MDLAKPITSLREFLFLKLEARLKVLNEDDVFIPNRGLTDIIIKAINSESDHLSILSGGNQLDRFVFTRTDLSPRNILVSEDPPQITGILDFGFSGFFPVLEEYQGNWGGDDGDWTKFAYRAFLERLDKNGVATPLQGDTKNKEERGM